MSITCPKCNTALNVEPNVPGETHQCPKCKAVLTVNDAGTGTGRSASCPGCGSAMDAATVICVSCGYDKRSGQKLAAKSTSPASGTPDGSEPPAVPQWANTVMGAVPILVYVVVSMSKGWGLFDGFFFFFGLMSAWFGLVILFLHRKSAKGVMGSLAMIVLGVPLAIYGLSDSEELDKPEAAASAKQEDKKKSKQDRSASKRKPRPAASKPAKKVKAPSRMYGTLERAQVLAALNVKAQTDLKYFRDRTTAGCDALVAAATDPENSRDVRARAIAVLGKLYKSIDASNRDAVIKSLEDLLYAKDASCRSHALETLGKLGNAALPTLANFGKGLRITTQDSANALRRIIDLFLKTEASTDVRVSFLVSVVTRDRRSYGSAARWRKDVQAYAEKALLAIGLPAVGALSLETQSPTAMGMCSRIVLASDPERTVAALDKTVMRKVCDRAFGLRDLAKNPESVARLRTLLKHLGDEGIALVRNAVEEGRGHVRFDNGLVFADLLDEAFLNEQLSRFNSRDKRTYEHAQLILEKNASAFVIKALTGFLGHEDTKFAVRARWALIHIGNEDVVQTMLKLLETDASDQAAKDALYVLTYLHNEREKRERLIPVLKKMVFDSRRITSTDARSTLRRWQVERPQEKPPLGPQDPKPTTQTPDPKVAKPEALRVVGACGARVTKALVAGHKVQVWKVTADGFGKGSYELSIRHALAGKQGAFFMTAWEDSNGDGRPDRELGRSRLMTGTQAGAWSNWRFRSQGRPLFVGNCWQEASTQVFYSTGTAPDGYVGLSPAVYYSRTFNKPPTQRTSGGRYTDIKLKKLD